MKIFIKAKPGSKKKFVKKINATHYIVAVKELPINNKANEAIIKSLAEFFEKPDSSILIIQGQTSKQKIIEVPLNLETLEKIGEPAQTKLKL